MNMALLCEKLEQAGLLIDGAADEIGCSRRELVRKLTGGAAFTAGEMQRLSDRLALSGKERTAIFFDGKDDFYSSNGD